MRTIDTIIIHATATPPEWMDNRPTDDKVAEIRRWHVDENGWRDIGYHIIIDRDGTVAYGRPVDQPGAHAKGHNTNSVGIALIGGKGGDRSDLFSDHFTPAQDASLRAAINSLKVQFPTINAVIGHNDVTASRACPCFPVSRWLAGKAPRNKPIQSKTLQASQVAKVAAAASPIAGFLSGIEWPQLLIIGAFALIVLFATGIIDMERLKRWNIGDR